MSPHGSSRGSNGRRLILCVDDEPHNLDLLDRSLRRRYDVLTEAMPEAALAAVAANDDLAVVLADYRMPSMDGVSMLSRIAAVRPDVRRVLVTGYSDADPVLAAVASGEVHSVVHKPWRGPELLALVDVLARARDLELENRRLSEELRDARVRLGDDVGRENLAPPDRFRDALTGLYTHGVFQERLREEAARAARAGHSLALLLLDLDGFAQVNAALGFQGGDQVLRRVAQLLISGDSPGRVRTGDIAARFAGEEFALLLPDTGKTGAIAKAERIREVISSAALPGDQHLTVTIGVAAYPDDATAPDALLDAATAALRAAKGGGKSNVHFIADAAPTQLVVAPPDTSGSDRFRPYHERMGEVVAILHRDRAVSCIYVDLSQLERIQQELGVAQHAELFDRAGMVLDGLRGQLLRTRDIICRSNDDDAYICLLSPRDSKQVDLERLTAAVTEAVASGLAPMVRELLRDEPRVNVGASRILSNPMVRPERLVARLIGEAHEAAKLSRQRAAQRDKSVLQDIILGDGLIAVYQPIVHIETGEIFGHEALTRGPRGTRMESPATLFAVADEVDLTYELDRACFRGALRRSVGLEPVHRLFVNLLPMSFYDSSFIELEVSHLLSAAALTPANIVFEISERLAIENFAAFRRALAIYTNMGFGVAIDDVGTRHSNLESVMALRPHFIKLSDVLTRGVARSTVKREMLRSLGHIAETIDAVMVAEGIETLDDLVALRELGIRYGQGFYLARPGPPFPRVRGSVRRSILAIGSRHLEPLTSKPADPDFEAGDHDGDESEEREEVTGELFDIAAVARGSGDFRVPPRHGEVGAADRPLREELRALAEAPEGSSEELGEIVEPGNAEDTQPHGPGRWRPTRPTPPSTDPRSRPLIESLRRRDEDAPPVPDVTTKPGLN
ncbi:MAG TPA: EAL domain-containing protein [Kofleriaceae bacterium]|nr:EAL domain-containing protein [Kofleriaceae bacterium]